MEALCLKKIRFMAQNAKEELRKAARADSTPVCIYLHRTAGHYGQFPRDYHIIIDADGKIYALTNNLAEVKNHTWRRNSGSIAIALACAYDAAIEDFGSDAPTETQYDSLAQTAAVLSMALDIPATSDRIMTHAEAAILDDYGPGSGDPESRWDLWFLKNGDTPGTGGIVLRQKINSYKESGKLDWVFD